MNNLHMNNAQTEKIHAEIAKLMAETAKINKEAMKISQETMKINKETFWYPMFVATGLVGSVATITTIIIKFI